MPMRRISLSAIKSKKNFPSCTTPTSARNFSSVFVKYENTQHSRILDNYRVRLSSKDVKDVRHFSISIVKFQDVGGSTVSESVSTQSTSSISSAAAEPSQEIVIDIVPPENFITQFIGKNEEPTILEAIPSTPTSETSSAAVVEESSSANEIVLDFLPDKPTPLEPSTPDSIQIMGELPFDSLGLNSLWPPGRAQWCMEHIHIDLGAPWWATILIMTTCIRMITLRFVIASQKNTAAMTNTMPQMQAIQAKVTDARNRGDMYDSAKYSMEMQKYSQEAGINPLKSVMPLMVQLPFFLGMFWGLRAMAQLPVASMCNGGLGWFEDLSVADPYYILPMVMCTTTFFQIKMGADGMNVGAMGPIAKKVIYLIPPVMFFFMKDFPAAVTLYWSCTAIISVGQAKLLRTEMMRNMFKIPKIKTWNKEQLPAQSKGFVETIKDAHKNYKTTAAIIDRRAYDENQFKEAGLAPVRKTYRFDPTKRVNATPKK